MVHLFVLHYDLLSLICHNYIVIYLGRLRKHYGPAQVHYWRTQGKKESDFVLKLPQATVPVETKLSFPRSIPAVLCTFDAAYHSDHSPAPAYRLVGLEGQPGETSMIYPWQLYEMQLV
jgi:hypothetical protein